MDVTRVLNTGYQHSSTPVANGESPQPSTQQRTAAPVPPPPMPVPIAEVTGFHAPGRGEPPERASVDDDALRRAVSEVNSSIATYRRHLDIRIHEATGRRMITVYDSETNEAIREIPPERVLDAHATILELAGLFVDTRG